MSITLNNGLRGLVKSGCATSMYYTGLDRIVGVCRGRREVPFVVGYHRVVEDFEYSSALSISSMLISTRMFEMHLDWIGKHYDFVSLDELALIFEGERKIRKPVAVITFDDGYQDVYRNAIPVLQRKGIPSAMFVVTDLVGTTQLAAHDELYLLLSATLAEGKTSAGDCCQQIAAGAALDEEQAGRLCSRARNVDDPFSAARAILETLSQSGVRQVIKVLRERTCISRNRLKEFHTVDWDMLREMSGAGVTVGSHTKSHVLLANEAARVVKDEVEGSRQVLEQRLGVPVEHFAYPDGSFSADSIAAVDRAGYRTALTICGHQDPGYPQLSIPRRIFWQNTSIDGFGRFSPAILSCQVNGIFDPADTCRRRHWAEPHPSRNSGFPLDARKY